MKPWVCASLLAALLGATHAHAQTPTARALIDQGRALRRSGRDADAYTRFVEAYRLTPSAEAAGQLGFAEHALGRWADADAHLRESLAATSDAWVASNRAALTFSAGEVARHVGSLSVRCEVSNATLELDGRRVGDVRAPTVIRVSAGPVALRIEAAGYQPDLRSLTVGAGETVETVCRLEPVAQATVAPAGPTLTPVEHGVVSGPTAPTREGARSNGHATLGWIAFGATLGAGTAVGVSWFMRERAADRWNDDNRCVTGGRTRAQNCGAEQEDVDQWHTVMIGSLVAAGVLAVGTVVLLATGSSRPAQRAMMCAPGLGSVGCVVTF